ncbi:uncharacterized protein (DUF305 family) [Nocardia tenerifensis]|uniref:Uncharacterized protein (DUF305 family) n=1 Tax=Nocardia tenerifensis TaxID=228006 RepID=A0A318KCC0_9NOCA|nr:DUF305 domain-containing protein [Nocardia tenerifensis]PXX68689.1 uncharacterized protein (DUF305 family) [Nocardia tenerifensis]
MFITRTRITSAITVGTAAAALVLAGCSDDDATPGMDHGASSTSASASAQATRTDFNDADLTFLQMMYPHHAQAVEMAKLVPSHSQNPQLRTLAANVEQAQAPEMRQITTLLQSFGKPAPAAGGHGGHAMPGMMSTDQMNALQAASGPDFDRQWLTMMIEHHTGAVAMAETELADGTNAESKAMARSIIDSQRAEIDTMRGMLGQS